MSFKAEPVQRPVVRLGPGRVVLVVGPSGAGKDSLLDGARTELAGDRRFVFPDRIISRPPHVSEAHLAVTAEAFSDAARAGAYALMWRAHDLSYGLPVSIDDDVRGGRTVVANTSRRIIGDARARYAEVRVVLIDAPAEIRALRLAARGRETLADIEARLRRTAGDFDAATADAIIENSGALHNGIGQLVRQLSAFADAAPFRRT